MPLAKNTGAEISYLSTHNVTLFPFSIQKFPMPGASALLLYQQTQKLSSAQQKTKTQTKHGRGMLTFRSALGLMFYQF